MVQLWIASLEGSIRNQEFNIIKQCYEKWVVNVWAESIEDGMFNIPKQKDKKKCGRYNSLS